VATRTHAALLKHKEIEMADLIDDVEKPNKTLHELWEILHYDEDLPVTLSALKKAVLADELQPTKFQNRNYYSVRDGLNWVAAQRGKRRSTSKFAAK
jgi:hypothetical protein